jgi:alpha-ketoglutaric semialdehyde dehydrogenase
MLRAFAKRGDILDDPLESRTRTARMIQRLRNLVGGEWRDGDPMPDINPSDTNDVVAEFACATSGDVTDAVAAARAALAPWSAAGIQRRRDVLGAAAAEIHARRRELGHLLSREAGKTLAEGVAEATRAGQIFDFFAGEALRVAGEKLPSVRVGVEVDVVREPVGVVAAITPWNFPIAIPAWKIAPGLCYGNAVVLKPSERAPASAWALVDILVRAGLPEGALNLVMGRGPAVGDALVQNADIDAVTFTGSRAVGQQMARHCADRLVRVQLEMGGKNPLVVLDDAELDRAVECAVNGAYYAAGQRCTASSRLIVTDGIHDRFLAGLTDHLGRLVVGHALDEGVDVGPVIDGEQLAKIETYLDAGHAAGARLVHGGGRVAARTPGFYLEPALFADTDASMRINREEIFGPVATVTRVRDFEEALAVANDTEYGLSAGICTTSLRYASAFRAGARAGMVMVNLPTAGVDYHVPFGGAKASSYGPREQGRHAAEFYTTVKTAYTSP